MTALDGVDPVIPAGEVHGLLGPNGSGKTTLCKILSTVLLPTSGHASVGGYDVVRETPAVRRIIGIVFGGERGLYTRLTARQNLEFWAAMYGLRGRTLRRRVDALLSRIGLTERADDRVEGFSRGMKQGHTPATGRAAAAMAGVRRPERPVAADRAAVLVGSPFRARPVLRRHVAPAASTRRVRRTRGHRRLDVLHGARVRRARAGPNGDAQPGPQRGHHSNAAVLLERLAGLGRRSGSIEFAA